MHAHSFERIIHSQQNAQISRHQRVQLGATHENIIETGQHTRISSKQVPVWLDSLQSRLEVLCRLLRELSARRQAPRPSEESPIIDACQDHCPAYVGGSGVSPPCLHLSTALVRKFPVCFPSHIPSTSQTHTRIISLGEMKLFSAMSGENQGIAPCAEQ